MGQLLTFFCKEIMELPVTSTLWRKEGFDPFIQLRARKKPKGTRDIAHHTRQSKYPETTFSADTH
jgi:hypothetical protein